MEQQQQEQLIEEQLKAAEEEEDPEVREALRQEMENLGARLKQVRDPGFLDQLKLKIQETEQRILEEKVARRKLRQYKNLFDEKLLKQRHDNLLTA